MFKNVEDSKAIMPVLACIIKGVNRAGDIQKILKEKQSSVSAKLMYLRDKNVVKKNRWIYEPNWSKILSIFYKLLKEESVKKAKTLLYPKPSKIREKDKIAKAIFEADKEFSLYLVEGLKKKLDKKIEEFIPENLAKKILTGYATFLLLTPTEPLSLREVVRELLNYLLKTEDKELKRYDKIYGSKMVSLKKVITEKRYLDLEDLKYQIMIDKDWEEKFWSEWERSFYDQ